MGLSLSKVIPAHIKTVELFWVKRDWLVMKPEFRKARRRCSSPMDTCFWCHHKFADGEMMALASPKVGRNKPLCQACTAKVEGSNGGITHE